MSRHSKIISLEPFKLIISMTSDFNEIKSNSHRDHSLFSNWIKNRFNQKAENYNKLVSLYILYARRTTKPPPFDVGQLLGSLRTRTATPARISHDFLQSKYCFRMPLLIYHPKVKVWPPATQRCLKTIFFL